MNIYIIKNSDSFYVLMLLVGQQDCLQPVKCSAQTYQKFSFWN